MSLVPSRTIHRFSPDRSLKVSALPFSPPGSAGPSLDSSVTTPLQPIGRGRPPMPPASPSPGHAKALEESERVIQQVLREADADRRKALAEVKRTKAKLEAVNLQLKQKVLNMMLMSVFEFTSAWLPPRIRCCAGHSIFVLASAVVFRTVCLFFDLRL